MKNLMYRILNNKLGLKKSILIIVALKCFIILVVLIIVLNNRGKSKAVRFISYQQNMNGCTWVGLEALSVNRKIVRDFGLSCRRGILVRRVINDSPAQRGGIRQGDVIKRIGNTRLRNLGQFKKILGAAEPGAVLRVIINRSGRNATLYVRSEARPSYYYDPNIKYAAYRNYVPPVSRPYPYFSFREDGYEIERE